jgi:hypothetical protein
MDHHVPQGVKRVNSVIKKVKVCWAPVAHACNQSYLEGRDQEDMVQSQPRQIVRETLFQKTLLKKGLVEPLKA